MCRPKTVPIRPLLQHLCPSRYSPPRHLPYVLSSPTAVLDSPGHVHSAARPTSVTHPRPFPCTMARAHSHYHAPNPHHSLCLRCARGYAHVAYVAVLSPAPGSWPCDPAPTAGKSVSRHDHRQSSRAIQGRLNGFRESCPLPWPTEQPDPSGSTCPCFSCRPDSLRRTG
jgi:hypothetical protein